MHANSPASRSIAIKRMARALASAAERQKESFDPINISEATLLDRQWKYRACMDLAKSEGWPCAPSTSVIGWCSKDTIGIFLDKFNLST